MQNRNYNVDLLRILAAMFVIILHVMGQGGILRNISPDGAAYWVAWFMEILAYCAINCFAIISGYVMINKTPRLKSIIGLWFQVLFYSLLITGLCFWFIPETRGLKNLIIACLPVLGKQWWYVSSYFALFFTIPILNTAINHKSQRTYKNFLLIILIGVCIADCIVPRDPFVMNDGYSPVWLGVLYFIGGYIRKYILQHKVTASKSAIAFFAVIMLTVLSKVCIRFVTQKILGEVKYDNIFISYTSITIVLAAIFLFTFCLNVKINNSFNKVIQFVSPAMFGVYLIHVHPLVFDYIIKDAFSAIANKHIFIMLLYVLVATMTIFLLCSVIDLGRIQFFKLIKVDHLCEIMDEKITKLWQRVFKE